MTDEERNGYRELFNVTGRFIQNGEAFEVELNKLSSSAARDGLLASVQKQLAKLREDAEELKKLGWGDGNV